VVYPPGQPGHATAVVIVVVRVTGGSAGRVDGGGGA